MAKRKSKSRRKTRTKTTRAKGGRARKPLIKWPKVPKIKRARPKRKPRNSTQLSRSDQARLQAINKKERAAKRKYGGRRPAKLRDEEYSQTVHVASGDVMVRLDTSAVPDVQIYVTEVGAPRRGGRREIRRASKTGFWRWRNK